MKHILTVLFLSFSIVANGQSTRIGSKAPELSFSKIINSVTKSAKLSDYRGKIVILDYWATWCAPCIASFPHLESIQKDFDKDVKIITITDESEEQ